MLAEHRWTREHAGRVRRLATWARRMLSLTERTGDAEADHAAISALIEPLISGDIARPEARPDPLHRAAERARAGSSTT